MAEQPVMLARIVIERVLEGDQDIITVEVDDGNGEAPPLVELLGMLEMARDTVYKFPETEEYEDE